MSVSRRAEARAERELRRETLIEASAELGLVALNGPADPEPSLVLEGGRVVELDGRPEAAFDVIDRFIAAHGIDPGAAAEAATLTDAGDRTAPRRRRRPARGARAALGRTHAGAARADCRHARSGRADVRAQEAASASPSGEPGPRHEPQGEPGAAGRRRRRGGRARLRGDRDDGRRRPLRAAECDRDPRRLPGGSPRRAHAVLGRGAPQPPARHPGADRVLGDAVGVRHRAVLRRRGRHAVVEGVPRIRLRVARDQGQVHVGRRLRGPDGARAGVLDAVPRGTVPLRRAGCRLTGRPERRHLHRRARPGSPRRHAGDPGREPDRGLARPRGRLRQ